MNITLCIVLSLSVSGVFAAGRHHDKDTNTDHYDHKKSAWFDRGFRTDINALKNGFDNLFVKARLMAVTIGHGILGDLLPEKTMEELRLAYIKLMDHAGKDETILSAFKTHVIDVAVDLNGQLDYFITKIDSLNDAYYEETLHKITDLPTANGKITHLLTCVTEAVSKVFMEGNHNVFLGSLQGMINRINRGEDFSASKDLWIQSAALVHKNYDPIFTKYDECIKHDTDGTGHGH